MDFEILWMQKAENHLITAKLLFDKGFSSSIVDVVYMAMFSAIKALLLKRNIECKTHEGLLYLFKINYVDNNLFNRDLFRQFCLCKESKTRYFNLSHAKSSEFDVWEYLNYSRDFIDDAWELI